MDVQGHIVFHPYTEEYIAGSSIDVTLGHWYFRTERNSNGGFYNPFDESDVNSYFEGPFAAETHEMWAQANGRKLFEGIPADQQIIVLGPGERVLAHTHEFIGIKAPGTSTMQARSTWGRNGVAVCTPRWGEGTRPPALLHASVRFAGTKTLRAAPFLSRQRALRSLYGTRTRAGR